MIRVVIAEDHPIVLKGLSIILQSAHDIQVIGTSKNGLETLEKVEYQNPDVLLLDIEMPVLNGMEVIRILKQAEHPVRVLVVSIYDDVNFIFGALSSGASGYLMKDEVPESIITAVHEIASGKSNVFSPKVAEKIEKLV